jgi:hypothetical protein
MSYWLNWINLDEAPALLVLIGILKFLSRQFQGETAETARRARQVTLVSFVMYAIAGLCEWGAPTVTKFLILIIKAALAAGIMYGIASILCPPLSYAAAQLKLKPKPRPAPPRPIVPPIEISPEERARMEEARRQAVLERQIKVNDAREEVEKFYSQHGALFCDEYPPALFRAQLHIQFPEEIEPSGAWIVSRNMISEMLPLIGKARDRQREQRTQRQEDVLRQEERQRAADQLRSQIADRQAAFQRLVKWYQSEQQTIKQALPEGPDQEDALHQLWERYDSLMKETYSEMRP